MDPDFASPNRPVPMNKQQWARHQAEKNQRHNDPAAPNASNVLSEEERLKKVERTYEILEKYEINFSRHLQILLDALNHYAATETVVLLGLCARLSTANQGTQ